MIPGFKLIQSIALFKESNAPRHTSLPGLDCPLIEGRTLADRQVIPKKDRENIALCRWKRAQWRKRKQALKVFIGGFYVQGMRHEYGRIRERFQKVSGLL